MKTHIFTIIIASILCITLTGLVGCKKNQNNTENTIPASEAPVIPAQNEQQQEPLTDKIEKEPDSPSKLSISDAEKLCKNPDSDEIPPIPEIVTEITYRDTNWGRIQHTKLKWNEKLSVYHEIPVFNDSYPGYESINTFFQKIDSFFFVPTSLDAIWEYHCNHLKNMQHDETYTNEFTVEMKDITDKLISVTLCQEWFMGGVADGGCTGYNFNPATGKPVPLTDYYKKSKEELHDIVKKAILEQREGSEAEIEWDSFNKYTDFNYYVSDGIVHVVFKKYEIAVGAAGAFDITLP